MYFDLILALIASANYGSTMALEVLNLKSSPDLLHPLLLLLSLSPSLCDLTPSWQLRSER